MNRAQIDRRIHAEFAREGLLGVWFIHRLTKDKRALRRTRHKSGSFPLVEVV